MRKERDKLIEGDTGYILSLLKTMIKCQRSKGDLEFEVIFLCRSRTQVKINHRGFYNKTSNQWDRILMLSQISKQSHMIRRNKHRERTAKSSMQLG